MSFTRARRILARVCARLLKKTAETVPLEKAFGRVAARDVLARMPSPPFDNSAMDGFAVRSRDVLRPGAELRITEVVPAGKTPVRAVVRGCCAAVMTGSRVPRGADAVVMKERAVVLRGGFVKILRPAPAGENIRLAGEDVEPGDVLVAGGAVFGPAEAGLAASQGLNSVAVSRRPVVAFFTTGDEIVMPGRRLSGSGIYNATRYTLAAAIEMSGCVPRYAGHLSDDIRSAAGAVGRVADECDAIVTSGGVSMGDFDIIKKALRSLGAKFIFERIEMKPGRPAGFAVLRGKPVFTLPGNVVSSLLSYDLLAAPNLSCGLAGFFPAGRAVSGFSYAKGDARRHFLRVVLKSGRGSARDTAYLKKAQGSGVLSSMSRFDALAVIPEGAGRVCAGSTFGLMRYRHRR